MNQALLPIPGYADQRTLPGLDVAGQRLAYRQPPLMSLVDDDPRPPLLPVIPGQMVLGGPEQRELTEVPLPAIQMSLLPDPPLWELDPGPPPAVLRGRLSRRRSRSGITAGQQSLF